MADKVLSTELYPYVENCFSNARNVRDFEAAVGKFIDKNSEYLSAIGPTHQILFTDKDRDVVYDLVKIDETSVKNIKNKSKDIKSNGQVMSNPFFSLMSMIIRYFTIEKKEQITRTAIVYLGLSMYPSLFYKYYRLNVVDNVMSYTINNLSNKYKIKQLGNLLAAIDETCYGAYTLHKNALIRGNDEDVVQFILAVKTRLNSFMKKIRNEYDKNHKSGKYLNIEFDSNDEGNYREADSSMYAVTRIVDKAALKLVVDGPPIKLIDSAAKVNKVSTSELRNYIGTMSTEENTKDIKTVVESILLLYLIDNQNTIEDINSNKFLLYCLDLYKRSNTADSNILKIKNILDKWLEDLGTYKKTQRKATINNFRRAIFTFFVMFIQYANMN